MPDSSMRLSNLLGDCETMIRSTRADADSTDTKLYDMRTNDFLIGLVEKYEKMAWMIRAYLEGS